MKYEDEFEICLTGAEPVSSVGKSTVSILVVMLLVVSGIAIFATANANASSTSPPPIAQLNKGWIGYDGNYVTVHISGTAI